MSSEAPAVAASPLVHSSLTEDEARRDRPHERALAEAALDRACGIVARHRWNPVPGSIDPAIAAAVRDAAAAFVAARRAEQRPPERVLAELKFEVKTALLRNGDGRDQEALREVVFAAFLSEYYQSGKRR